MDRTSPVLLDRKVNLQSVWREGIALLVCVGLGTAYYGYCFSSLFPLSEFHDWVTWPANWDTAADTLLNLLTRADPAFSREAGMLYVRAVGDHCGPQIGCLNLWMLLPPTLSAVLLYVLARRLRLTRGFAAAAVLYWWFSLPVADAFGWQATIHDRLALLFALAALLLAFVVIDAQRNLRSLTIGNIAVSIPWILAYNSKEAAWFLAPSLLLGLWLLRSGDGYRKLEGTFLFLVPLGYAAYNNLRYFLLGFHVNPDWEPHVFGGSVVSNLPRFSMGLAGFRASWLPWFLAALLGVMVVVATSPRCRAYLRKCARAIPVPMATILWCFGTLALALTIPIRTRHTPFYYLYLPEVFFALGVMGLLQFLFAGARGRRREAMIVMGLFAVLAVAHLVHFQHKLSRHPRQMVTYSANFLETLDTLVTEFGPARLPNLVFVRPIASGDAFMFCETPTRRSIFRYAVDEMKLSAIPDGPSRLVEHTYCETDHPRTEGGSIPICVFLTDEMRIETIRRPGKVF